MSTSPTPPPAVGEVYELLNGSDNMFGGGSRYGLFATLEGAQDHAVTIHRAYLAQQDGLTEDEREEVEHVHAGELTWSVVQLHLPGRPDVPLGDPVPLARYSDTSYFHIATRPLHA